MSLIFTDTLQTYDSTGLYTLQAFVNGEWLDLHMITGVTTGNVEVDAMVNTIDVDTTLLIPGWSYDFRWIDSIGNVSNITNLPIPSDSSGSGSGSGSSTTVTGSIILNSALLDGTNIDLSFSYSNITPGHQLGVELSADGNIWVNTAIYYFAGTVSQMAVPVTFSYSFSVGPPCYVRVIDEDDGSIVSNAIYIGASVTITNYITDLTLGRLDIYFVSDGFVIPNNITIYASADGITFELLQASTTVSDGMGHIITEFYYGLYTVTSAGSNFYIQLVDENHTTPVYSNIVYVGVNTSSGSSGTSYPISITSYSFSGSVLELFFNYSGLTIGDNLQVQESPDGNIWTPTTAEYPVGMITETGTSLSFPISLLTVPSPYLRLVDLNDGSIISNAIQAI